MTHHALLSFVSTAFPTEVWLGLASHRGSDRVPSDVSFACIGSLSCVCCCVHTGIALTAYVVSCVSLKQGSGLKFREDRGFWGIMSERLASLIECIPIVRKRFRKGNKWIREPDDSSNSLQTTKAIEVNYNTLRTVIRWMPGQKLSIHTLEPEAGFSDIARLALKTKAPKTNNLMTRPLLCAGEVPLQEDGPRARGPQAGVDRRLEHPNYGILHAEAAEGFRAPGTESKGSFAKLRGFCMHALIVVIYGC